MNTNNEGIEWKLVNNKIKKKFLNAVAKERGEPYEEMEHTYKIANPVMILELKDGLTVCRMKKNTPDELDRLYNKNMDKLIFSKQKKLTDKQWKKLFNERD